MDQIFRGWSGLVIILGKKKTPKTSLSNKKRFSCLCPRYCYFSSCCHVRFSYFLHTNVDIFKTFTWFYLIFDLSEFWWNFWSGVSLDPRKHNSDQKITKNHQKIFLTTLLYGICSLDAQEILICIVRMDVPCVINSFK